MASVEIRVQVVGRLDASYCGTHQCGSVAATMHSVVGAMWKVQNTSVIYKCNVQRENC